VFGIEARLRVGRFEVRILLGERDFIYYRKFRQALGPTLPSTQFFVDVISSRKMAGPKLNQLSPSSAENKWN